MDNLKNIFVIDDDKSIRWVLEKALTKKGFNVFCYKTSEDMINALEEVVPNVIISDGLPLYKLLNISDNSIQFFDIYLI